MAVKRRRRVRKRNREKEPKRIGYKRFALEAGLDVWSFRTTGAVLLFFPVTGLRSLLNRVVGYGGGTLTTANLSSAAVWQIPLILLLGALIALCYIAIEILAQICLCEDILRNHRAGILREMRRGFAALKRFVGPFGLLVFLFVVIVVPLIGVGFSVSLTKDFYIPRFISSVILSKPLYAAAYYIAIAVLSVVSFFGVFTFHAVLIDRMKPRAAFRHSRRLVRTNLRNFLKRMILLLLLFGAFLFAVWVLTEVVPLVYLTIKETDLLDAALLVFVGRYTMYVAHIFLSGYFFFQITRIYFIYTERETEEYFARRTKRANASMAAGFVGVYLAVTALAVIVGVFFDDLIDHGDVGVVAHRTGGFLASENSLEGIDRAVEYGCAGSETDIQRTKDGYYIINHDTTFGRLTGDDRKPGEMTLDEIRALRIADTTGTGARLPVPTLEELLDRGKGRVTLYLELKGESADRQMADDVAAAVRARDMVDDVVLISLNYDVIDYAERTYPEFETGVLIFGALGDVTKLNCDMIIMEEEMSTDATFYAIHNAGKTAGVWTVNTEGAMRHFLDSEADAVITDDVAMAFAVKEQLAARTDLEKMRDFASEIFGGS